MAAEGNFKIVDYSEDAQYGCHNCKYRELAMTEEPCETCVTECVNIDSHKPVKWEEAK